MIEWIAGISTLVFGAAFVLLTLLGLPGIWLTLLAAVVWELATPETTLFSAWSLGSAGVLTILGEVVEFGAGAAGAKVGGGGKRAAWGAVIGGVLGGLLGTFILPIPVVGTIVGAAIGSGAGAMIGHIDEAESRRALLKVGSAAFAGRLVAIVAKCIIGVMVVLLLAVAAVVPGF